MSVIVVIQKALQHYYALNDVGVQNQSDQNHHCHARTEDLNNTAYTATWSDSQTEYEPDATHGESQVSQSGRPNVLLTFEHRHALTDIGIQLQSDTVLGHSAPESRFANKNILSYIEALPAEVGVNKIILLLDATSRDNLAASCSLGFKMVHRNCAHFAATHNQHGILTGWSWSVRSPKRINENTNGRNYVRGRSSLEMKHVEVSGAVVDFEAVAFSSYSTTCALVAVTQFSKLQCLELSNSEHLTVAPIMQLVKDLKQLKFCVIEDCDMVDPISLIDQWTAEVAHVSLDYGISDMLMEGTFAILNAKQVHAWTALAIWSIPVICARMPQMLDIRGSFYASLVCGLSSQHSRQEIKTRLTRLIQACVEFGPGNLAIPDVPDINTSKDTFTALYHEVATSHSRALSGKEYFQAAIAIFEVVDAHVSKTDERVASPDKNREVHRQGLNNVAAKSPNKIPRDGVGHRTPLGPHHTTSSKAAVPSETRGASSTMTTAKIKRNQDRTQPPPFRFSAEVITKQETPQTSVGSIQDSVATAMGARMHMIRERAKHLRDAQSQHDESARNYPTKFKSWW